MAEPTGSSAKTAVAVGAGAVALAVTAPILLPLLGIGAIATVLGTGGLAVLGGLGGWWTVKKDVTKEPY